MLKVAGHRIGTAEVEDAAVSHEGIAEAAVVSKADPVKGASIAIFVRVNTGVDATDSLKQELRDRIRQAVGAHATPDAVYFVSALPKTRSGKIMRRILKAVAENTDVGDLSTLEDRTAVDEAIRSYQGNAS